MKRRGTTESMNSIDLSPYEDSAKPGLLKKCNEKKFSSLEKGFNGSWKETQLVKISAILFDKKQTNSA